MPGSRFLKFATTHWSLVRGAGAQSRESLEALCRIYWPAVYSFVRRQVRDTSTAQDLTQEFFARLLAKNLPAKANPARGRFRSFLLASVKNYLSNERARARAAKRGGRLKIFQLDFQREDSKVIPEPVNAQTPERHFERQWALALLDQVMARLRTDYAENGKEQVFEELKETLTGAEVPLAAIAKRLDMTPNAAKVAAHRLRKRYRDLLKFEVAQTLADPAEIDDEIRRLFAALATD